ncbi:hypothetical protein [Antarctobacter sp.]|uniref:hypothetical protein n=1 Tax=Antarctobacter sp. TaxID=1872577 RepID=UPI002B26FB3B|nr:hypothetical protein [Antarctobacter sp.]
MITTKTLIAGALGAALLAAPVRADIWWETDMGTLYWESTVDTYSVFQFFIASSSDIDPTFKIFVDGTSQLHTLDELSGKTFGGIWYDYEDGDCGLAARDPNGQTARNWGLVTITFGAGGDNFSAVLKDCATHDVAHRLTGTPGL